MIHLSMKSKLSTFWAQWLCPKRPQKLCKICWSTVLLAYSKIAMVCTLTEKWAFIRKGKAFHGLLFSIILFISQTGPFFLRHFECLVTVLATEWFFNLKVFTFLTKNGKWKKEQHSISSKNGKLKHYFLNFSFGKKHIFFAKFSKKVSTIEGLY